MLSSLLPFIEMTLMKVRMYAPICDWFD